jgi:hypothetical protein
VSWACEEIANVKTQNETHPRKTRRFMRDKIGGVGRKVKVKSEIRRLKPELRTLRTHNERTRLEL